MSSESMAQWRMTLSKNDKLSVMLSENGLTIIDDNNSASVYLTPEQMLALADALILTAKHHASL